MRAPLFSAAAALIALAFPAGSDAQGMMDQKVMAKCSAAIQADFDKAGKTPPAGLIQQTCSCVVQQLDATHNIEVAKNICRQQAQAGM